MRLSSWKSLAKRAERRPKRLLTHVKNDSGTMTMRKKKKKRLESKGWKIGSVKEFLGLSNEESAYIELKIKLAAGLRQRRREKGLSQLDLAAKLQSSQSRVA